MNSKLFVLSLGIVAICLSSCVNLKQLRYMQGNIDTANLGPVKYVEPTIQPGDRLSVLVYSDNQLASAYFNQTSATNVPGTTGAQGAIGAATGATGYEVDEDGVIQLYKFGPTKVEGLTRRQLSESLAKKLYTDSLLRNPFVEVKFLNFKVTVLGDVNKPGPITFPNERVNIFDALALAGDLSVYARRDSILIIREKDDKRQFARLDLTSPDIMNSPYYYLRQNDMIIVDPVKQKAQQNDQAFRYVTLVTSVVSVVAIIISIFR